MIYLDYNSTAPLLPQAKNAMLQAFELIGNPSSVHAHGRSARKSLELARDQLANYFKVPARNITFTSGATEANNLIIKGFQGPIIIESSAHDSLLSASNNFELLPVNESGIINLKSLENYLKKYSQSLVVIMAVNNETGVIQPVDEINNICRKYKAYLHVDAVQAATKLALDYANLPSFSVSAHKFGGPKGIGAVVINSEITLSAQIKGGGQERGIRAGTENIIGAVGMGAALEHAPDWSSLSSLRDHLEENLFKISNDLVFFGKSSPRISNTSCFALPGIKSEVQLMQFDSHNISISSGAACSSGKVKVSHVLKAMGLSDDIARCAIRISTGWYTTLSHIDNFLDVWKKLYANNSVRDN